MHSRCETASLHAACTSLSEAHDDARSLQTDMKLFSRKAVVSEVAPTRDQLTNEIDYAGRLHSRLWCVLKFENEDHYAIEDSFGYSDNQNANAQTFNSRSFGVSPHNTHAPMTLHRTLKISPQELETWPIIKVMKADWPTIRWLKSPHTFFEKMEREHRASFWKTKTRSLQTDLGMFSRKKDHPTASSVDLSQYFTRNFFDARPRNVPTAPGALRNSHKYGILTQNGQSRYFQVVNYESLDKDEDTVKNIGVKRCYDSITKPVVFNDKGPMSIEDWPYILIWPDMDVVYILNPNEYFDQSNLQTQNKWPIGKPDQALPAAMRRTWPRTDASTNPYIVQRFGAATALDPDFSMQTQWAWPRWSRRSNSVAPEPALRKTPEYFRIAMNQRRIPLNQPSSSIEFLARNQPTADARFKLCQNNFWTSQDCGLTIPCAGSIRGQTVYVCYYRLGEKLLECFVFEHPSERKTRFFMTRNPRDLMTGIKIQDDVKVPKNSPDVLWFTAETQDTSARRKDV